MAKKNNKNKGAKKEHTNNGNGNSTVVDSAATQQNTINETDTPAVENGNNNVESENSANKDDNPADLNSSNKIVDNKSQELESELHELKVQLTEKDTKFNEITKQKDEELEVLKKQLATTEAKLNKLEETANQNQSRTDDTDNSELQSQLDKAIEEKNKYKDNYDTLLKRISQMKDVFTKMKKSESQWELCEAENKKLKDLVSMSNDKIKSLESNLEQMKEEVENLNTECDKLSTNNSDLKEQLDSQDFELENESKKLEDENKKLKRELREVKSDLEEYLILIQEEKMSKTNLNQEIADSKSKIEELNSLKQKTENKCKDLMLEITKLNETIVDFKKGSKEESQNLESQLANKNKQIESLNTEIELLKSSVLEKDTKLQAFSELESELKEKQLLIGKLRHETITLNEHLTKAMKLVKKESGKETVDRELVSNLFISFLQIPRGDTKKFEVLQLLANFLDWDDEKKRHAGLISSGNYKAHSSSVVEVPVPGRSSSHSNAQSFVSLWTEFLEKESTPREDPV